MVLIFAGSLCQWLVKSWGGFHCCQCSKSPITSNPAQKDFREYVPSIKSCFGAGEFFSPTTASLPDLRSKRLACQEVMVQMVPKVRTALRASSSSEVGQTGFQRSQNAGSPADFQGPASWSTSPSNGFIHQL